MAGRVDEYTIAAVNTYSRVTAARAYMMVSRSRLVRRAEMAWSRLVDWCAEAAEANPNVAPSGMSTTSTSKLRTLTGRIRRRWRTAAGDTTIGSAPVRGPSALLLRPNVVAS